MTGALLSFSRLSAAFLTTRTAIAVPTMPPTTSSTTMATTSRRRVMTHSHDFSLVVPVGPVGSRGIGWPPPTLFGCGVRIGLDSGEKVRYCRRRTCVRATRLRRSVGRATNRGSAAPAATPRAWRCLGLTPARGVDNNILLPVASGVRFAQSQARGIPMNMSRKLGLTVVAAALITVYGCGKEEPKKSAEAPKTTAAAPADDSVTVKIGHAGPLTGGIAHLGKDDENGARLAIDEHTQRKLKIGGKTVKFELMSEDDQADPKMGPTIAQKLADAKVAGVAGHLNSGVSIPASAVYNQAGIPMISGSATNPKLTEQGFKNIFRTVGRDDQQGPAIAQYLANMKVKKVAIADDATAYGEGLANEVEKTLKAAGVQVVAREKATDKTTDFKAILTKMKGKAPDAVFYGGMDATGGPMIKQARELGIKSVFSFGDGACTDEMAKLAGPAAEGLICSQAGLPASAASQVVQRGVQGEVRRSEAIRAVLLRRRRRHDRRDAEGGFD